MSDQGSESGAARTGEHDDAELARLIEAALAGHRAGHFDEAATAYAAVLERRPRDADVLHRLGALRYQQGRHDEALTLLGRAVCITPNDLRLHNTLGSVLLATGRVEEAVAAFAHATGRDPGFAEAFFNLGTAYYALERFEEARGAYTRAIELSPGMVEAHTNLGLVLRACGERERALECFQRAIELEPRFAQAHLNLGFALADRREWQAALASFNRALAVKPGAGEIWYYAGLALKALGREDEAGERFQRAAELAPHFVPAHEALLAELERVGSSEVHAARANLGTALLAGGRVREAIDEFDRIIAGTRENTRAVAHKWVALTALGEHDAAAELVDFARFLEVRHPPCPSGYADMADFNEALAEHVQSHPTLESDPEDHATRSGLHSGELLTGEQGPIAELAALIDSAVADYRARLGSGEHPFLASLPARWKLNVWAIILDAAGHQVPHLHPGAWLSGVYYVRMPSAGADDTEHAGWIEFGEPSPDFPLVVTPRDRHRVRPEPGLMVLFPSYFYHRTIPFAGTGRRISIAFDVLRSG